MSLKFYWISCSFQYNLEVFIQKLNLYLCFLQVEAVLAMLDVLVKDQPDQPTAEPDVEDFMEEQGLLAR